MPLPLTLLCAPSAVLRDRLVRNLLGRRTDLVVVAYDMPEVLTRVDVSRRLLEATGVLEDERVPLLHDCVSCTVRDDVLPVLARLADLDRWDAVVLALPVPVLPEAVAEVLRWEAADHVRLAGVTTAVDALTLCAQLSGDDLLTGLGLASARSDRRSLAELLAAQVEQADVVALAHAERVGTAQARTVETLLAHLAPLARRVPVGPGGEGSTELVGPDRTTGPDERRRLSVLAHELLEPSDGVATLVWRSDRPLSPQRLHATLPEAIAPVQRGRGHLQLANRPSQVLRYESAGATVSIGVLGEPPQALPCCELVLTGVGLDVEALRRHLDRCVVTDDEPAGGDDPFAGALG